MLGKSPFKLSPHVPIETISDGIIKIMSRVKECHEIIFVIRARIR